MQKDAFYFSHDSNARNDPKIMALIKTYGIQGYGWFWILIETLSEQKGYKLSHKQWVYDALAMAMLCDCDSTIKFIDDCINQYELLKSDEEYFWSESLLRRMKLKEDKRQKRIEAGKKGAKNRWKDGNAIAMPDQPHSNAIAKDGKGKESKEKENKEKKKYAEFVSMTESEYQKLIETYGEEATKIMIKILDNYKGSNGKKYKSDYRAILSWVVNRYQEEHSKSHSAQSKPKTDLDVYEYSPSWREERLPL